MRSYKLSELLGLSGAYARKFDFGVSKIEAKKPELKSVSAQIMAELYRKSYNIEKRLGFSGDSILMIEAFSALVNHLNDEGFWAEFGNAIFFAEDGLVSANKKDVEKNKRIMNLAEHSKDFFEKELKQQILEKYQQEFSNYSIKQIQEKLF